MNKFPSNLEEKLRKRLENNALRTLDVNEKGIDFFSNDYLGFAKNRTIHKNVADYIEKEHLLNGSTGSRLMSGTKSLHLEVEEMLARFHHAEAGLLFNSGYDANVGLFSSILHKNDILLFDELTHASIRDGVRMSNVSAYKFKHNNVLDLEKKLLKFKGNAQQLYVVVDSVYSMDGDTAHLKEIAELCNRHKVNLIVDEAHSGGVFGEMGKGLVVELGLEKQIFARIHTFGKAIGCHGAVVIGSNRLRDYLINFSRSFIYTTAISLHSVLFIKFSYQQLQDDSINKLHFLISFFNQKLLDLNLNTFFIKSTSAIHCCVVKGNKEVKSLANILNGKGFLVKPVLSPTVQKGQERLRICLHIYNTQKEIEILLNLISFFLKN